MNQLKNIMARLKNPSVVISVASQIISVLVLFRVQLDRSMIITAITTACSILVLLGIMSNPDTINKGYGDDLIECESCHEVTAHVRVGDHLVCQKCGHIHSKYRVENKKILQM